MTPGCRRRRREACRPEGQAGWGIAQGSLGDRPHGPGRAMPDPGAMNENLLSPPASPASPTSSRVTRRIPRRGHLGHGHRRVPAPGGRGRVRGRAMGPHPGCGEAGRTGPAVQRLPAGRSGPASAVAGHRHRALPPGRLPDPGGQRGRGRPCRGQLVDHGAGRGNGRIVAFWVLDRVDRSSVLEWATTAAAVVAAIGLGARSGVPVPADPGRHGRGCGRRRRVASGHQLGPGGRARARWWRRRPRWPRWVRASMARLGLTGSEPRLARGAGRGRGRGRCWGARPPGATAWCWWWPRR